MYRNVNSNNSNIDLSKQADVDILRELIKQRMARRLDATRQFQEKAKQLNEQMRRGY